MGHGRVASQPIVRELIEMGWVDNGVGLSVWLGIR
jgi:hypothetical protein